ncbi:hypothetical protein K492DRAFT_158679 [Lichtheimia hyalospora FSU 10163]|nr:hypothetical protein K492DRAFT_158679 [Lichtheimia hyalospora FSU 10163]
MVNIFKLVQDNNVDQIREYTQATSADIATRPSHTLNQDRPQQQQQQQQPNNSRNYKAQRQVNLNKRSIRGRTALHCAVSWNRIAITKLLLECPWVNINIQDRENGWTALHRACYTGNVEIALMLLQHPDIDLNVKDYEGIRPLELLTVSLGNMKRLERNLNDNDHNESTKSIMDEADNDLHDSILRSNKRPIISGGTDLYTWGSNTNYVLGHSDSESRTYPERVSLTLESQQLPNIMRRPLVLIERVHMSKYHTAVLTSEPRNNLLLCGFGHGGRLGNGKKEDTQLIPTPLQWPERITAVALGRDHTVAISENGNVITFGSNENGQLGYEIDDKYQLFPRKVQSPLLKKLSIIGAAASSVHSVVYTAYEVFTFGYNQGQLGYHASGDELRQVLPRKVAFSTRITDVAANDHATAVLYETHEISVLCNYGQQKIVLPTDRFPSGIQVHHSAAHYPIKLITGVDEYLGAISNNGEVYVWTCKGPGSRQLDKNRAKGKNVNISSPKRVWLLKKPYLAATDASLGHHGSLIVSTLCGQVFVGKSTKDGQYKFNIIPNLQRCIRVCASPSGAFSGIRSEVEVDDITTTRSTFISDIKTSLPHIIAAERLDRDIKRITNEYNDKLDDLMRQSDGNDEMNQETNAMERQKTHDIFDNELRSVVDTAWKYAEQLAIRDMTLDAVIILPGAKRKLYCHQCILACRSRFFSQLFQSNEFRDPALSIVRHQKHIEIRLMRDYSMSAFLLLFDYLYTDIYMHPMSAYYNTPNLARFNDPASPAVVGKDLAALASLFELDELHESAIHSFSNIPRPTLTSDLLNLFEEEKTISRPNVCLDLKDGQHVLCHEMIVRQRCEFFRALFEPGSIWMQSRREQQSPYLHVDMTHISEQVAVPFLRYLYGDLDEMQLFGDICKETTESMMRFLVQVLCLADELLLYRLKTICERALLRFIGLRSAPSLLEASDIYMADALKHACLQFITSNIDVLMATGMIDHLESKLIRDIEKHVRSCQADEMPFIRQINTMKPATTQDDNDPELSDSLYTRSLEDQPIISNYAESLITIMPEHTNSSTSKSDDDVDGGVFRMDEDQPSPIKEQRKKKSTPREKKGKRVALEVVTDAGAVGTSRSGWAVKSDSAENKRSLREIMEEQPDISSTPPSSLGKSPPVYIPKKLSQKERRKLQQQQQQQEMAAALAASPKPVWGKVIAPLTTPPPESLASFPAMNEPTPSSGDASVNETTVEETSPNDGTSKGMKIYISKEELMQQTERPGYRNQDTDKDETVFDPIRSLGSSFSLAPIRRQRGNNKTSHWSKQQGGETSSSSFQAIQKQQELEDLWIKGKQSRKSLVRIQSEERAIESLKQFYVQTLDALSGEWVDVHRLDE